MNCLCCGKVLTEPELQNKWHRKCVKRFFGTSEIPEIDISEKAIETLAKETINRGFTVAGVQKKLSLHLFSERQPRLTLVDYPTGFIMKPQVNDFRNLPEAEHLVMSMAEKCGIKTVPHGLIQMNNQNAYITRRIDRLFDGDNTEMFAMEDFCQLDFRLTQDKYKGSYERCARIIEKYSSRPMLDKTELFIRLVFSFISCNSDMHLKNFSLIETVPGNSEYILSPAYDLLPVNLVMPEDKEQTALTLNGKKKNIRKKDFYAFADNCEISGKSAEKMISGILKKHETLIEMITHSLLPEDMKKDFINLVNQRTEVLK